MTCKSFATTLSFVILSGVCAAAPAKPGDKSAKTVTPAKPKSVAAIQKTGVNITPLTRNRSASKVTLQLAKDGKSLLPIIVSEKASAGTKAVADDLKKYLDQMSGAAFEIKTGDGSAGIVLGSKSEFPVAALNNALAIVNGFDGKEAYAIRTREKKVMLLGATDQGASHAAYRFLEELGCRWFFPAREWHVIPKNADLKFSLDITDRPSFLSRAIWPAWGLHDGKGPDGRGAGEDSWLWQRRNHMGASFKSDGGHANEDIARTMPERFEGHPEYAALVKQADGTFKRQWPQFDYGNAGLRQVIVDYAIKYFKDRPDVDMLSVSPADGDGYSESPEAKAYGTPSESVYKMANQVARALQKAYPGQNKMVSLYGYSWHSDPPSFPLEPNVSVALTTAFNNGSLSFEELIEQWPKKTKNLTFRDYYSVWAWDYDRWPGGRISGKGYAIDIIRLFEKANAASGAVATSISAESGFNWGPNGRGYYLASQLMWNPQRDPEAILDDFYQKAFGAGAAAMKRYYNFIDERPPMSPGVIGALFRAVDEASRATRNDAAVQRRLDDIKHYLRYEHLNQLSNTPEAYKLAYRTRWSYMTHWYAMSANGAGSPSTDPEKKPAWQDETPVTHEETEAWFQEGLKFFPDLKVPPQIKFSKDLVPVNMGGERVAFQSSRYGNYHNGVALYLYSSGAPLRLHLDKLSGPDFAGENLFVTDANGKRIASVVPDKAAQTSFDLNIPVPAPGVYELHHSKSNQQWSFKAPAQQIIAYPTALDSTISTHGDGTPDLYFYVPKGTREINYYFQRTYNQNYGPHAVVDPNGKVVKEVDVNGEYVVVPVAAGLDGKMWHFGKPTDKSKGTFGLGQFHFFNVPNVLTASPAQMLLPRDVVAKDGLKAVK